MSKFLAGEESVAFEVADSVGPIQNNNTESGSHSDETNDTENLAKKVAGLNVEDEGEQLQIESEFNLEMNLNLANEAKEEGNKYFRVKDYDNAISMYSRAVALCPVDDESKETLAVFLGNRAAAYYAVDEYECTIDDCSRSLDLKPDYIKVLMRRSQAYEKVSKPEDALADAKKVMELDPTYPKIDATVKRLEKVCEERMAKLKDEALGKLKDLGNTILGNFGLSLDNFKMTQDPKSGSWNISMGK